MIAENDDFLTIKLNPEFYEMESVLEAFKELEKYTESVFKHEDYFVINIRKKEDSKEYAYEFINYVLKIMKEKGVV